MFKLNDKKHRKRALLKLQQCKPNCGADGEKDDFYDVSSEHQVTKKIVEHAVQYNLDEAPNHLVRKTMKFEEVRLKNDGRGFDEVDRAESSKFSKQVSLDFPTIERNIQSKVEQSLAIRIGSRTLMNFKFTIRPRFQCKRFFAVVTSSEIDFN